MKPLISLLLIFVLASCGKKQNTSPASKPLAENKSEDTTSIQFKNQKTLSITGNFSGKGEDILTAAITDSLGKPLQRVPDPMKSDWDTLVRYYFRMGYYTTISLKTGTTPKLTFTGQGVYCLINIGDNNNDGKDEIALVPDLPDYSNLNSCHIYSVCDGTWKKLFSFGIFEGAFDFTGDIGPAFKTIPDFFEKQGKSWEYRDYYNQDEYDSLTYLNQMKKLIIPNCK